MNEKTNWSYNDDLVCCEEFVKAYIVNNDDTDYTILVHNLSLKLKNLQTSSIKMKLSNIVYILNELKIKHNCNLAPLSKYSEQNLKALFDVFNKYNVIFNKELVINLVYKKLTNN